MDQFLNIVRPSIKEKNERNFSDSFLKKCFKCASKILRGKILTLEEYIELRLRENRYTRREKGDESKEGK